MHAPPNVILSDATAVLYGKLYCLRCARCIRWVEGMKQGPYKWYNQCAHTLHMRIIRHLRAAGRHHMQWGEGSAPRCHWKIPGKHFYNKIITNIKQRRDVNKQTTLFTKSPQNEAHICAGVAGSCLTTFNTSISGTNLKKVQ